MMREKPIPKYIDQNRMYLNSVIVEPLRASDLWEICEKRRAQREMLRALKANAAIAFEGIITFGVEAQRDFETLTVEAQNAAYREIAEAVASRLNTDITGLVVHRDETAPHAHFQMPGFDRTGNPLNKTVKRGVTSELQTIAAEVVQRHVASIERGVSKYQRLREGAEWSDVVNKSVRRLHDDLPADIAKLEAEREALIAKIEKNEQLAERSAEKAAESEAAAKRAETYENRVKAAKTALQGLEGQLDAMRGKQLTLAALEARLEPVARAVAAMDRFKQAQQEYAAYPHDEVFKVVSVHEHARIWHGHVGGNAYSDPVTFALKDTQGRDVEGWWFRRTEGFASDLREALEDVLEAAGELWVRVTRWGDGLPVDAAPCDPPPRKPKISREVATILAGLDQDAISQVRSLSSSHSPGR